MPIGTDVENTTQADLRGGKKKEDRSDLAAAIRARQSAKVQVPKKASDDDIAKVTATSSP